MLFAVVGLLAWSPWEAQRVSGLLEVSSKPPLSGRQRAWTEVAGTEASVSSPSSGTSGRAGPTKLILMLALPLSGAGDTWSVLNMGQERWLMLTGALHT